MHPLCSEARGKSKLKTAAFFFKFRPIQHTCFDFFSAAQRRVVEPNTPLHADAEHTRVHEQSYDRPRERRTLQKGGVGLRTAEVDDSARDMCHADGEKDDQQHEQRMALEHDRAHTEVSSDPQAAHPQQEQQRQ